MWNANHGESEVCGSRPSGQCLKISDTGLFLSHKNRLTFVFMNSSDMPADTSFNEQTAVCGVNSGFQVTENEVNTVTF